MFSFVARCHGALPWRVGVGEEHLDAGVDRELRVSGQLLASVPRQRANTPAGMDPIVVCRASFMAMAP